MKRTLASVIALIISMLLTANAREPEKSIRGVYAIADRPFDVDPDPDDTRRRVYLELYGDVAKEMYRAIKGEVHRNVCGISGLRLKQTKNIVCMVKQPSNNYECVLVLNTQSGDIENGFSC
jgi:hypothetical protein